MNHGRILLLGLLIAAAALAGSHADRAGAAGSGPLATTSTAFLTIAEARQATRREVFRIARRRGDVVDGFRIEWCRRRSGLQVGCRYYLGLDDGTMRGVECDGGARVVERAANRHHVRAWRQCDTGAAD